MSEEDVGSRVHMQAVRSVNVGRFSERKKE